MIPACTNCNAHRDGLCRRHPPVRLPRRFTGTNTRERVEEVAWSWPEVRPNDWCAEHRLVLSQLIKRLANVLSGVAIVCAIGVLVHAIIAGH